MNEFRRPAHRIVLEALGAFNRNFLERNEIYFGGGTRIVLELGEYRESRDMDFMCASQAGYRALRETVSETSLGEVWGPKMSRAVRTDQYGVRTWLELGGVNLKFEIVREARIALGSVHVQSLPVACLDRTSCFAEKFLANADRGLDASTLSRDAIDLAFMVQGWSIEAARKGAALARLAYGSEIDARLAAVAHKLKTDRKYRAACIDGMAIEDTRSLAKGLDRLAQGGAALA